MSSGKYSINTSLHDFALVTFYIDPSKVKNQVPPGFELYTIKLDDQDKGLVSLVSFTEEGLHLSGLPFLKFNFKQIDYRLYLRNKTTGELVIWFLSTVSDSWLNIIPKLLWRLPWKSADISLAHNNKSYHLISRISNKEDFFLITDTHVPVTKLPGFNSLSEGLAVLTGTTTGYYKRNRKTFGYYNIWHSHINPSVGIFEGGEINSLKYLSNELILHSVLLAPKVEFIAYLPPKKYKPSRSI